MTAPRTIFAYKQLNANSKDRSEWALKNSWKKKFWFRKFLGCFVLFLIIAWIWVGAVWMQINVFKNLPDVGEVKDMVFSQATIITDKNGVELYKLFDENREYVEINQISQYMIDAIVAMEDQHYWEHEWLDPWWIFRAALKGKWWWSTLPQQLMTNVFKLKAWLSSANKNRLEYKLDKVAYKLRQIVLAKRLNTTFQKQIKAENPHLSDTEAKREMKKKVLELYLNYIEFWNNSFWVEAASKSFFGISASKLSVAQSAILASLPKWPWQYSPLTEKWRKSLMWYFKITDTVWMEYPYEGVLKQDIIAKFTDAIKQADFSNKKSSNSSVNLLQWLGSFNLILDWKEYYIQFFNWRKDVVLSRMLEDGYITEEEYKKAEIESLSIEFKSASFSIKAPHFVFWIKELLEEKYGESAVMEWGLIVKTSLDYSIQQMAEEAFRNNVRTLYENGANNSSMLYVNTDNWDVLAYVWSLDYFNDEIQWQIDMVKSRRQSGSSIKPLIYALWFMNLPITLDTPIYDIEYQIWPDKPNNADNKFYGLMSLKAALWNSRNIPAIKMFVAEWWEWVVKPFLRSLGLPLSDDINYGYPLAIGAAEVSLLEFASAYSYLTTETPAELNPILEITSSDGSVLYTKEVAEKEDLIPAWVRYLIWKILSDPNNRLPGWVSKFNVSGLTYALKTGTSNMKTERWNRPRDWLVAAYMPDNLILMWAGNADASPMNSNAFGWTIHAQPLKDFLWWLLKWWYISNREMTNVETANITISKITWKIPGDSTPGEFMVSTMWFIDNLPTEVDSGVAASYEYDASCLWVVSPTTPIDEVKKWYIMELSTFMPGNDDLQKIKEWWTEKAKIPVGWEWSVSINILPKVPEWYCEGREPVISDSIKVTIIDPETDQRISAKPSILYSVKGDSLLRSLNITVDWVLVYTKEYRKQTEDLSTVDIDLSNFTPWMHTITVQAIDANWKTNNASITDLLEANDTEPPYIVFDQSSKQRQSNGEYQISLLFDDHLSWIPGWSISVDWTVITKFEWRLASFTTKSDSFDVEVKDNFGNVLNQTVELSELK